MKVKSCRFCLAVNVKVFKLGNTAKKNFIENILKQNGFNQKIFESHFICYECQALLDKSYNFIQRILRAQGILQKMVKSNVITVTAFKEIDRQKHGISTTLLTDVLKNIDIFGTGDDVASSDQDETESTDPIKIPDVKDTIDIEHIQINSTEEYETIDEQKNTIDGLLIKDESDIETHSFNNSVGELESNVKHEITHDSVENEFKNEDILNVIKEESTENITENVPRKKKPKLELSKNKEILKVTKEKSTDVATEKVTNKVPRRIRPKLALSKFIISLSSIGDKRQRRNKNKLPLYDKEDDFKSSVSSDESSDSSDNEVVYDYNGKLKKKLGQRNEIDEDFRPSVSSEESSDSSDNEVKYDDKGKLMKKRKREYPRQCDHCDYEVPEGRVHHHHYLIHHPNTPYPYAQKIKQLYVCQFCGKIFKTMGIHRDHELTHSTTEPRHLCSKCPKTFANQSRLYRHRYNAHPKKILECDYCGKKCKTRSTMTLHMRTHTGEKPFKCHLCGAGFAHRGNVGIHIRSNHQQAKIKRKTKKAKSTRRRKYSSDSADDSLSLLQLKKKKDVRKKKVKRTKVKAKDAPVVGAK